MRHGLRLRTIAGLRSIAIILFLSSALSGQSTASIEGQVVDEHGEVVPGAHITLRDLTVGTERFTLRGNTSSPLYSLAIISFKSGGESMRER